MVDYRDDFPCFYPFLKELIMKPISTCKFTSLLCAVILLISLGTASAQWKTGSSGGSSTFNDSVVVTSGNVAITGTLTTTDPLSLYWSGGQGSHYYQIVAGSKVTPVPTFRIDSSGGVGPTLTILSSNLQLLQKPISWINTTGGLGYSTSTYGIQAGVTYYIEVSYLLDLALYPAPASVPFVFTISNGVLSAAQVSGSTHGIGAGVPSINGSLTSSTPSHARPGCYADYYTLTGPGTTNLIMSGFDTYLYLYDNQFNLIAKNDDANPPGHGGSLINQVLAVSGTYYVEATSYAKNVKGNYTLSTSVGGLSPIPNPWDPTVSGSTTNAVPLAYTSAGSLSAGSMSNVRSGSYANYYLLHTTTGGQTTITTTGLVGSAPVDTYLYLYDQNNNVIASNDDHTPPGSGGALISANLGTGNNYTVEVTTYRAAKAGTYTLTVSSPVSSGSVSAIANPF